jgi:hypothetical protein
MKLCQFENGTCVFCQTARQNDRQICWRDPPQQFRLMPPQAPGPPGGGPGTELSRLLKRFKIEPTPTCACPAMAAQMDAWGPDECERPERIAEVVAVMRAEAAARGLPFLDSVGRTLVRRAISTARANNGA